MADETERAGDAVNGVTTSHFESFDGTQLAIHRTGEGRPVILLHGLFSSAEMNWIKWGHAQRLADARFEAIMLDFRVHGQSEAPTDPMRYPPDVLVRDVAALVDYLALEDYDLAGFSLGARTSLHCVAKGVLAPARLVIAGMGLAGVSDWNRRSAFFRRVIDEFDTIKPGDPAYYSRQFLKSQGVDRVAARLLLDSMTDLDPAALANVTMPTLVVCGDEDQDNGSARELVEHLPNAVYVETPGAHLISATKPEMGEAIVKFLSQEA
ncbi:alpha/beta fold hydrolase [Altererythrobacter lutimaris]|uniref:Alpha/beta fold hydrolase n=1 Tax=Altererythrobacter lutimaris TaxID=2743979 RepID=A0A850HGH2_9SPHN|nr:alpha/beta fold hydrolase [Altererythrobacter lutimaris]NVE93822.1 alpha/beta fold hydrolase [Altererythrobacter lutimaris]